MNKRLSIFDLQEGCTYAAFDGARKLSRTYKVTDGKLMNDEGTEGGHYVGCAWVPLKASITFEKIAGPANGSKLQSSKASTTNVLGLIEGVVYQASGLGEVVRKGDNLHSITNGKVSTSPLSMDQVNLKLAFRPLDVQPKTATKSVTKTGKTPKKEFQCGFEQVQIEAPSFFKLLALNELKWTQRKNENGAFVFGFKHGHIVTSTDPLTGEHMDGGAPEIGVAGSIGVEGTKAFRDRVAKFLKRNADYKRYDKSERKFI